MAVRTHEAYIDAEARLGRRFGRNPALLTAAQVQGNLLHLLRDSHLARSSVNQYGCALQIVYGTVLAQPPEAFQIPLPRALQALPKVLARQALAQWFASACHFNARSFLMLADGSGLRVAHLDSHADRLCTHVVQGKGGKGHYVPPMQTTAQTLTEFAANPC